MDEITLILIGLTFLFFIVQLFGKANRDISLAGATFGICAVAALLLEPWGEFSLLLLLPLCMCELLLIGGGVIGNDSE